jgi:hypothetical protein
MIILINDIANFGRGRDKQPRKKRNALIGAIGGTAIGAGIGYATKPSKYQIHAEHQNKRFDKYLKNKISDLDTDKYDFNGDIDNYNYLKKDYTDNYNNWKNNKKENIKIAKLRNQLDDLSNSYFPRDKRLAFKAAKLSNKIGNKRALIGSGVGLAAGLGGAFLYNKFKNDNSKRR